jgi:hypothetical protein
MGAPRRDLQDLKSGSDQRGDQAASIAAGLSTPITASVAS